MFFILRYVYIESVDEFKHYLKTLYASLTPTQVSADSWPLAGTHEVFNLAMIKSKNVRRGEIQDEFVRQTITGKIDDILHDKHPIELKDIFNKTEGKRKVVLLEGAPGCGKSTLSVYISQQWAEGKLFTEFKLVVLIQLRDPVIQAATCLADLLPARDNEMQQQAAIIIGSNYGRGVLFILDGWDELPSNLRIKSILYNLVDPKSSLSNPLQQTAVIITSRPIASCDLHPLVTSRIEILGFTPKELTNYFTECLKGDSKAVETLLERIHENPEIAGSCYLPMNASILVHLFESGNKALPTTQYGIFSELVLSCIYRHLNEHTKLKNLTLESLQQIPDSIREPFLFLCKLAYQGVMNDQFIFSSLPANVNTLGLLQGVESFVKRGKAVSYNFLHLSIQEILAGLYIATHLPDDEQVSKFDELFDKSRFSAVFQFYAAITKLQTSGIKDIVIRVAKNGNINNNNNKALLLSLLHCLYEAQYPPLCVTVAEQFKFGLNLRFGTTLTPSHCLCIGYFLSHICKMDNSGNFDVNLECCGIGDQGCKYLVSSLHKNLYANNVTSKALAMYLSDNVITDSGIHHLSKLLEVGCISDLYLGVSSHTHRHHMLRVTLVPRQSHLDHGTLFYRNNANQFGSLQGILLLIIILLYS